MLLTRTNLKLHKHIQGKYIHNNMHQMANSSSIWIVVSFELFLLKSLKFGQSSLVYLNTIFHWCRNWMVVWHEAKQKYLVLLTRFNLSLRLWEISLPRTKCKSPSLMIRLLPLMFSNKIMYKVKFMAYDYPIININNKDNLIFQLVYVWHKCWDLMQLFENFLKASTCHDIGIMLEMIDVIHS